MGTRKTDNKWSNIDRGYCKNNNIILVGGPVANNIVAGLVQRGQSKVDWYTSLGEVEYIPNGLYPGHDVIIVAGADRKRPEMQYYN